MTVPKATGINHVCFALDNFDADGVFGSNACHFGAQAADRLTFLALTSFCCSSIAGSELQSQGKHDLALQGGPAKSGVEDLSAIRAIDASLRNIQIDVVEEVEHVGAELK